MAMTLQNITMDYISARTDVDERGCWIWRGAKAGAGYGYFRLRGEGKNFYAHRTVYWLTHGEWPEVAMHTCDVMACCNPDHIVAGTQLDNVADMMAKGRDVRVHGTEHPKSKIDEDDVRAIRASSMSSRKIAPLYGISFGVVGQIRRREIWKHVD